MAVNCPVCGGLGYELVDGLPEECNECEGKGYLAFIPTKEDEDEEDLD